MRGGREGGGAHLNINFSEFFPFRYKLFFIIEKCRSSLETIGESLVSTTNPTYTRVRLKIPDGGTVDLILFEAVM